MNLLTPLLRCMLALALLGGGSLQALAQDAAPLPGVYTCVDAKGRKLTADRPIPECLDREQQVLNPSGTVKAKVAPSLTALERAALENKARTEAEERNRQEDEKRRDRALLTRYPSKAVHDQERAQALEQITLVIKTATLRTEELKRQRASLDAEMEFYKKDPSKAPPYLRRQIDENTQNQAGQARFVADQDAEIRRLNIRFDDELVRLRQLWHTNQ